MYDQKQKKLVGLLDGKEISRRNEGKMLGFQKSLGARATEAELHFEKNVAKLISEEAHTPYRKQKIFHMTDGVAFVADFYFPNLRAVVEIDGPNHLKSREQQWDAWRDSLLDKVGITVLRIPNKHVLQSTNEVFNQVVRYLADRNVGTPSHLKYLRKVYSHLV